MTALTFRARVQSAARLPAARVKPVLYILGAIGLYEVVLQGNNPPLGIIVLSGLGGLPNALVGIGLILIYRANRVINFAQSALGGGAAMLGALLMKLEHVPYPIAILATLAAAALVGAISEFVFMRRFSDAPRLVMMIATIGLSLFLTILQFVVPLLFGVHLGGNGGRSVDIAPPITAFSHLDFTISRVRFTGNVVFMAAVTLLVVGGLSTFFRRSRYGVAIRAAAENTERAALMGISVRRLSTMVWTIGAMLSGLALLLNVPVNGVNLTPQIGPVSLVYGLTAAVIARMESFRLALVGGVAIGIFTQSIFYIYNDPFLPVAVMVPVLLGALLLQPKRASRGEELSLASVRQGAQFRPIPPELRRLPEVVWGRFGLSAVGLALLLVLPLALDVTKQVLASVIVIYAIACVSLTILTGWAGQISLGQWGFAGVGAFVTGWMAAHENMDFFVVLLCAGLAGALAALLIGIPALRIQGLFLAVTTLAFGIAVHVYLLSPSYFEPVLPGVQGIVRPRLFGHYSIDGPVAFYYVALVALAAALASASTMRRTRAGRVMMAVRDNAKAAQSYGINLARVRLAAFAISGFWAAVAGALFVYGQGAIDQAAFDPALSIQLMTIVVIGGVSSLSGAMLGAAYLGAMQYGNLGPQAQLLATGLGVLILLMVAPGGVAQGFFAARDGLLRRIAARRGILVSSLVADKRTATLDEALHGHVHVERPLVPEVA